MRNIKKLLALVLVLVMAMSFAGAAFTDAESIQYEEAVEVLAAAGVINGYEDGSFKPEGTLERDEAAKIIAYLSLGGAVPAAVVDAIDNPFTDVNSWATDYIKWCYAEGIVDGIGDNKFDPDGKLTGYAFAKMLLVTIGVDGEYTGANWKKNVLNAADEAGLLAGLETVVLSAELSREQAAQMAFNAAKAGGKTVIVGYQVVGTPMVFDSYYEAFVVGGSKAENVTTLTKTTGCLLSDVHSITAGTPTTDDFGYFEAVEWIYTDAKGNETVIYNEMAPVSHVYTSAVTDAKLRADLGLAKNAAVTNTTANGKVVAFYQVAKKVVDFSSYAVVEINYAATKVAVVTNKLTGDVTYTLDGVDFVDYSAATQAKDPTKVDEVVLHGEIADGAWVTYVEGVNTKAAHIYPTTSAAATLTGYSEANGTLTLSGAKKAISAAAGSTAVAAYTANMGKEVAYSYDMFGYLVGLTPVKTEVVVPTQFAYVYMIQSQEYKAAGTADLLGNVSLKAQDAAAKALVALTDGSTAIVDLALAPVKDAYGNVVNYEYVQPNADGTVTKITVPTGSATVGAWFAYTEKDGAYTLAPVTGSAAYATVLGENVTLLKGKSNIVAGKYTNSATTLVAVDAAVNNYKVTTHTGLLKADMTLVAGNTLVTYAPNSTVVSAIYTVDAAITTAAPTVTYDYYLAVASGDTVAGGVEWTFYVNGDVETLVINGAGVEAGKVYTLQANTGVLAGTYSVHSTVATSATAKVTVADETFFVAGTTYYYNTNGCEIYNITTEVGYDVDTVEVGDYVIVVNGEKGVELIYIVDEPQA